MFCIVDYQHHLRQSMSNNVLKQTWTSHGNVCDFRRRVRYVFDIKILRTCVFLNGIEDDTIPLKTSYFLILIRKFKITKLFMMFFGEELFYRVAQRGGDGVKLGDMNIFLIILLWGASLNFPIFFFNHHGDCRLCIYRH